MLNHFCLAVYKCHVICQLDKCVKMTNSHFLSLEKGNYLISVKMAENGFIPLYNIDASLMRFHLSIYLEQLNVLFS